MIFTLSVLDTVLLYTVYTNYKKYINIYKTSVSPGSLQQIMP
jgi:hypothetical protein